MKKLYLILISILLIGGICFIWCKNDKEVVVNISNEEIKDNLKAYLKQLEPFANRIPEFSNINEADEDWIWWCLRNYGWSEFKQDNAIRSVTYEDLTEVKNKKLTLTDKDGESITFNRK